MAFHKLLIANRGEIARRVIRTAQRLGYETVAVFSDADAGALHVREADEAVHIGGAAPAASYLRSEAIIEAAKRTGAGAIHPGYGFLSENAEFAEACAEAGIIFVGPPADAIRAMGDKARAKARMADADVPTLPGYLGEDQSAERFAAEAEKVGFPLLVKAVSGGGGRGMRLVDRPEDLEEALTSARREAESAFGDGTLMLERRVDGARHIEVQVFADTHGNAVHLFERDCSTQRRRQKVIEEAPSPVVDSELRDRMGEDAVAAAQAVGYVGAGTVELIFDPPSRHYYFLEMNTRLQVEHPVTEAITGQDLVEWQLRVAAGEKLPLTQAEIPRRGHAIELRLYAEDPSAGFAPQTGAVLHYQPADAGERVDAAIASGDEITPHYDPMVSKVIAWGHDRTEATRRARAALRRTPLVGPVTNRAFLLGLLGHDDFVNAQLDTATLDRWLEEGHPVLARPTPSDEAWQLAALLLAKGESDWHRSRPPAELPVAVNCGDDQRSFTLTLTGGGAIFGEGDDATTMTLLDRNEHTLRYETGGVQRKAFVFERGGRLYLDLGQGLLTFTEPSPYPIREEADDPSRIASPVTGTLVSVAVKVGDAVEAGAVVASVEAMKMETRLEARVPGTVTAVHRAAGEQVDTGDLVIELEANEQES